MENKTNLLYAIASALVIKLWIKGHISDNEKMQIDNKNKASFIKK